MCACTSLCLTVGILCLGKRLDGFAQFFLEVAGKFRGMSAKYQINYFDVFEHKDIFPEGKNVAQVAFRSIISAGVGYCFL